jgi:AraC-like DNA-binding protein
MGPLPYRELPVPTGLEDRVACLWVRPPAAARSVLVIPDGCVDLIWRTHGELVVAGPDRGPVQRDQPAGVAHVGIRLRPGVAGATLGADASSIADQLVDAHDLWGRTARRLVDRLQRADDVGAQLGVLSTVIAERCERGRIDTDVAAVAAGLAAGRSRLSDTVRATGVSERQMRRRFHAQVGYGPKTLERIMRLQRFLDAVRRAAGAPRAEPGLAVLAAEIGYADQAHLIRDCRALTGRTPTDLLRALA